MTTLTSGELLTYEGEAGSSQTLQDGQQYSVQVVNQSNLNAIQIRLQDTVRMPIFGTLTGTGQSFTIQDLPTDGDIVTVALNDGATVTQLTEGADAGVPGRVGPRFSPREWPVLFRSCAQSKLVDVIQIQLTASYPITPSGTLVGTVLTSFTITASDPNTGILTVSEQTGATVPQLTEGETLTYEGPSVATPGYLQNDQQYSVHIIDQSDPNNIQVELSLTQLQAGYGTLTSGERFVRDPRRRSGERHPDRFPRRHCAPRSTDGDTLTFAGVSGSGDTYLQNDQSYTVAVVVNQDDPNNIQVKLADYLVPTYGTPGDDRSDNLVHDHERRSDVPDHGRRARHRNGCAHRGANAGIHRRLVAGRRGLAERPVVQRCTSSTQAIRKPFRSCCSIQQDPTSPRSPPDGTDPVEQLHSDRSLGHAHPERDDRDLSRAGGPGTEIGGLQDGVSYQAVVDASAPSVVHLVQLAVGTAGQPVELGAERDAHRVMGRPLRSRAATDT